jgi:hypothetical protein
MPHGKLVVEIEREDYSRWIAEVVAPPGVMAYGSMRDEALARVEMSALRVLALPWCDEWRPSSGSSM